MLYLFWATLIMIVVLVISSVLTLHGVTLFVVGVTAAERRLGPLQHFEGLPDLEALEVLIDSFVKGMPTLFRFVFGDDCSVFAKSFTHYFTV